MNYKDIQLTDKELWAQFQSLYQSGNYASALAFLQLHPSVHETQQYSHQAKESARYSA